MNDIWSEFEHPGTLLQFAGAALSVILVGAFQICYGRPGYMVPVKLLFLGVLNWFVVIPVLGAVMQELESGRYPDFHSSYRDFQGHEDVFIGIAFFITLAVVVNMVLTLWLFRESADY
jgi:hypothetical protein